MIAYRIYAAPPSNSVNEEANLRDIDKAACHAGLTAYTVWPTTGIWLGASEPAYCIEFVDSHALAKTRRAVYDTARQLRAAWSQTAVLVTAQPLIECALVTEQTGGVL